MSTANMLDEDGKPILDMATMTTDQAKWSRKQGIA
jgi:hypothetical protein